MFAQGAITLIADFLKMCASVGIMFTIDVRLTLVTTTAVRQFGEVLGEKDLPHERIAVAGRVALLLTDGAEKNPYAFLDEERIPPEFARALQQSSIEAGPDLAVSSMVPRPIDLGPITSAAGETIERFEKWPLLRMLVLWALFVAALAGIFYATR